MVTVTVLVDVDAILRVLTALKQAVREAMVDFDDKQRSRDNEQATSSFQKPTTSNMATDLEAQSAAASTADSATAQQAGAIAALQAQTQASEVAAIRRTIKRRPARKQEEAEKTPLEQSGSTYNVWYHKWAGGNR